MNFVIATTLEQAELVAKEQGWSTDEWDYAQDHVKFYGVHPEGHEVWVAPLIRQDASPARSTVYFDTIEVARRRGFPIREVAT